MKINPLKQEPRPVDVSEWNADVKAFCRPLNGFEQLVFNDYFVTFYSRANSTEERFNAGFAAAVMALTDETGAPLLVESDAEAIRAASFRPLVRLFAVGLESEPAEIETAKKN